LPIRPSSFLALLLVLGAAPLSAQAPLLSTLGGPRGYGSECLYRNDDGSSSSIDLRSAFPSGLRFFSDTHTSAYVNTNGNITFSRALGTYTPNPFPVAAQPMIAPYWADVDIRTPTGGLFGCESGISGSCTSTGDNSVWWHLEEGRMIVTWDNVGYYSCHTDLRMSFQLILTAVPGCGGAEGDFDVEFRFNRCEWETGDASSGTGGFGGTEAQSGFDAGNSRDFVEIEGSREPGIAEHLCTSSNIGDPGVWRFQIRAGAVLCPEAGEPCETGDLGVCAEGVTACVGSGTECVPVVPSSDERCDAIDNDCDGEVDEGDDLCGGGTQVCDRGTCIDVCFEGGCPEGQVCSEAGRCVVDGCDDVECPAGQRCVAGGECVGACEGVVCPAGQDCRGGRCLDLCAELTCDPECSVCERGECVTRCDHPGGGCATGETCMDDGTCEPTGCVGVTCDPGSVCVAGSGCVDACEGTMCPSGERCTLGECVSEMSLMPDAGPMPDTDGDGGAPPAVPGDAGMGDAGRMGVVPRRDDGCSCAAPGAPERDVPWAPMLGLLGLVLARRRRHALGRLGQVSGARVGRG